MAHPLCLILLTGLAALAPEATAAAIHPASVVQGSLTTTYTCAADGSRQQGNGDPT